MAISARGVEEAIIFVDRAHGVGTRAGDLSYRHVKTGLRKLSCLCLFSLVLQIAPEA
jgi:hypothetical protein